MRLLNRSLAILLTLLMLGTLPGLGGLPVARGQSDAKPLRLTTGMSALRFYRDGKWGGVHAQVANLSDRDRDLTLAVSMAGLPNLQFARRLWLPAGVRRGVDLPVLPRLKAADADQIGLTARLIQNGDAGEQTTLSSDGLVPVWPDQMTAAALCGGNDNVGSDLASRLRKALSDEVRFTYINSEDMPDRAEYLSSLDAIVIAGPSEFTAAQTRAIRHWLSAGGRLWLMLDAVDPALGPRLLGDRWSLTELDRTRVGSFTLAGPEKEASVELDYPVPMVRVSPGTMRVTHTAGGYPAGLWQDVGRGRVFVTTLRGDAWLTGAAREKVPAVGGLKPALVDQGGSRSKIGADPVDSVLGGLARQQIGYRVIGRGLVLAVLGGFVLVLLVVGLVLAKKQRLEYATPVAVVAAAVAAGVLVFAGVGRQNQVPTTLSVARLISVNTPDGMAHDRSMLSVYRPSSARGEATLQSRQTWPMPDRADVGGGILRVLWEDYGDWSLQNMSLSPGAVHSMRAHQWSRLSPAPSVVCRFTEAGLTGTIQPGVFGELRDTLILAPAGRYALRPGADGAFTITDEDRLSPGEYVRATVYGQSQMRHQDAYQQLVTPATYPDRATLMGWADSPSPAVSLAGGPDQPSDQPRRITSVLASVLLAPAPSEPGQAIHVPAGFIGFTPVESTIYDTKNRTWIHPISSPQEVLMRYRLPSAVRGAQLTSAVLSINLRAPGRPYEVVVRRDGQERVVATGDAPNGLIRFELAGEDLPTVDEDGAMVAGVRVLDPDQPTDTVPGWSLTGLELAVDAVAGP